MRLLAQFVAVLLLVGFGGRVFLVDRRRGGRRERWRGWPFAHIRSRGLRSRPMPKSRVSQTTVFGAQRPMLRTLHD